MLILLFAAIAPVLFLLAFIYFKDKKAPEPTDLLFKAFRFGILSAIVVMIVLSPFASSDEPANFIQSLRVSFFEAGIPEEFFKWLFLYLLVWRAPQFDEYIDGIVYAVFVSMGFACLENVLYVLPNGIPCAVSRALLSVPAHFLFAVIMGYYFSMARFHPEDRTRYMACSIFLPMLAHGLFDTMAFWMGTLETQSCYLVVFILFVIGDIWLWRKGARLIRTSVLSSDVLHAEAESLQFAQAQEAAEALPAALPTDGEWRDTPIAVYHVSQEESTPIDRVTTFKLLIECKADAKVFINEKDAFFAKANTNYRLTLPAGDYTIRAVNLARYEQMASQQVSLTENRRIIVAFNPWEKLPAWGRTLIIGLASVVLMWWLSAR